MAAGLVAALLGTGAIAQESAKTDAAPAPKKTCRSLTPTGSMMSTRVCNDSEGWKSFDRQTAEGAAQFQNVTRMTSTGVRR